MGICMHACMCALWVEVDSDRTDRQTVGGMEGWMWEKGGRGNEIEDLSSRKDVQYVETENRIE